MNARAVNRCWFSCVDLDEFEIHFVRPNALSGIVQHFSKHYENKYIGIALRKIVTTNIYQFPFYHITALTQLTSLEVTYEGGAFRWLSPTFLYALTNLQRLSEMDTGSTLTNLTTLEIRNTAEFPLLQHYTKLRHLKIQQYRTNDDPFAPIANPSRFTKLEVYMSQVRLTESGLNKLSQFYNLKELSFRTITEQTSARLCLTHLTSLEKLNSTDGFSDDIFTLTRLTYLVVGSAYNRSDPLSDIQKVSALQRLKYLEIHSEERNSFDFSFVSYLTHLEDFKTYTNVAATETLKHLNSQNLTRLVMVGLTTDLILGDINKLSTLLELTVSDAFFKNSPDYQGGLSPLKNLTRLVIQPSLVLLVQPTMLDALENLKSLEFSTYPWTRQLPEDFTFKNLPNLEHLNLPYAPSILAYNSLQYLTRLTYLSARFTAKVFTANPTVLNNLPLKKLVFSRKIVTPELWSMLTHLRALEHLVIWRVDSEEIIESFSVLTNLTHLTIKKMKMRHKVRGLHLTKLTNLQELSFRAHPRKYYARLPYDYLIQKGMTRLSVLNLR